MEYLEFITKELILFISVYTIVVLVLNSMWLHPKDLETWKEWNRERNNRTRQLKKQIKEWNRQRNNRTRELKKQIKEWGRNKFRNCKAWRKKNVSPKWKKATPFKKIYTVFSCIIGFALFILFIILYSQLFLVPLGLSHLKLSDIDSGFALAFLGTVTGGVALFSGFLAILRSEEDKRQNEIAKSQADTAIKQSQIANEQSKIANDQNKITEQGLITDRINKAVEGLGKINQKDSPVREVRLGAIYALERIAQDSIDDHVRIMKIMCGYIRINRPLLDKTGKTTAIPLDIRAATTIIGERDNWIKSNEHLNKEVEQNYKLDLRNCDLHNVELYKANLENILLTGSTIRTAILPDINFRNAELIRTDMSDAILTGADMTGAYTNGSFAHTGDFSSCLTFSQEQINKMFLGAGVKLADGLNHPQEGTDYYKIYDTPEEFFAAYDEWKETQP